MSRQKSSNLAKMKDQVKWFAEALEELGKELDSLRTDSESLKELLPALAKVKAVLSPAMAPEKTVDETTHTEEAASLPPVNRQKHPRKHGLRQAEKKEPIIIEEPTTPP